MTDTTEMVSTSGYVTMSETVGPDRLIAMIEMQRRLQEQLGHKFETMTLRERIVYIRDMVLALSNELQAEVMQECAWKPWLTDDSKLFINERAIFGELIDVWHFLMNLMLVVRPTLTPEQLAHEMYRGYVHKREVNVNRQRIGYDGVESKCPNCSRDVADMVVHEVHLGSGKVIYICGGCGLNLPSDVKQYLDRLG